MTDHFFRVNCLKKGLIFLEAEKHPGRLGIVLNPKHDGGSADLKAFCGFIERNRAIGEPHFQVADQVFSEVFG